MKKPLFASVAAVAFAAMGGASWAQVGGNAIPKYAAVTTHTTNQKVTSHGVGGNSMPSYPKAEHSVRRACCVYASKGDHDAQRDHRVPRG